MSIVLGELQRDVRACPYFRGRGVCSSADIEIGSLASQIPGSAEVLLSTAHLAVTR